MKAPTKPGRQVLLGGGDTVVAAILRQRARPRLGDGEFDAEPARQTELIAHEGHDVYDVALPDVLLEKDSVDFEALAEYCYESEREGWLVQ